MELVYGKRWITEGVGHGETKEGLMGAMAVIERLKEFGRTQRDSNAGPLDQQTETLVWQNPFAFLVAVAFDRGMPWEKAWRIPTEIHQRGLLDPAQLAAMDEVDLAALLNGLSVRPRWGTKQGAKTLSDAARLVAERFGGNAEAIWRDSPPAEVEKILQEIHGLGPGIASMATRILHDDFGCFTGQERQIDVKPDVHLVRVFVRTGLSDSDSANEVTHAARRLNPEFPGELDWPAWRIGQVWCHPTEPDCGGCPLTADCAKRL